jgi:Uma2 family endonuclease
MSMASPALQAEPQTEVQTAGFDDGLAPDCDGQNDGRAVTLEQYLHTVYSPDCDYVDGHLQERNLGELDHGDLQSEILYIFRTNARAWHVKAIVELRLQVAPREFRIPDVMVLHPGQKQTQIIREAPLLCIEVLSPEDRFSRLKKKIDKYVALGVPHIWAFDPATREAYVCDAAGFHRVTTADLTIPDTPIRLTLASVFSILDDRQ